ncbi:MAG: hypothetical protein WC277_04205 [Bacilli bacterium]
MSRIEPRNWIDVEIGKAQVVDKRIVLHLSCTLTPSFYAFADALMYSAHKYYPRLLQIGGKRHE